MRIIIAADGSGDYTSLQAAVDATPEGAELFLRTGVYRERVVIHRDGLRLIGEDAERTVITASGCAKDPDENGREQGTFLSATLLVSGSRVTVENLTVRNDAGDGRLVGQAVAVYAAGDRGFWRNVRMLAHQDTLYCGPLNPKVAAFIAPRRGSAELADVENLGNSPLTQSVQRFENCFIRGDVDFIFGAYRCLFDRCTLYMNARGGYYTASNSAEGQPWGMVFRSCTLTGECEEGQGWLGRPWRRFARTVFLNCEMDACVAPRGFCDWDSERVVTGLCGEYGTTGARSDLTQRDPREKRLSPREAAAYEALFNRAEA